MGYRITRKIESYIEIHNGSKPISPLGGAKPKTLAVETPPLRVGGVIC
jgi:hypothetical protein